METNTEERIHGTGPLSAPPCSAWSLTPPDRGGEWWVKHGHGRPSTVSMGDPSGLCSTDPEKMTVKSAFGEELTLALYLGIHHSAGIPLWWAKATPPDGWESLMPNDEAQQRATNDAPSTEDATGALAAAPLFGVAAHSRKTL